ncbi:MAG: hypothetical protein IKL43_07165 [Alistipes sp.]|nr:hypothetical protein [Alistipes sp.]MBR3590768.1 hypothetical protein [Alistipes sp.]
MKRLCFILIALCMVSCASYIQVATLNSDTVQLSDKGEFYYEDEIVRIEYSFNQAANGLFSFSIKNLTAEDIYVDMAKSYFINNGIAADYYGRSTTVTVGTSSSDSYLFSENVSSTYTTSKSVSETKTAASYVGIPCESARVFTGFMISDTRYTEKGFKEYPYQGDTEVREFNKDESPLVIINRITLIVGGEEIVIENKMYATKYVNAVNNINTYYQTYSDYMGNNQFYILYKDEYEYNYN